MTFGSLFTGIGGLDLGLDRIGMECRWQVEIDPYAVKVLEKHWPDVKRYGDITKITGDELEPVDLICGGFPCQDLSQAGKRAGIKGTRSGLWFEYARLVGILRPRFVLIENVPGLLVPGAMRRVVGELARLGYVGIWRSLRASEFGASHLRKRVFLVAYTAEPRSMWQTETDLGEPRPEHDSGNLADSQRTRLEERDGQRELPFHRDSTALAPGLPAFAPGPSDPRWPYILRERPDVAPALESSIRGVADGFSGDMDGAMSNRTKRLGRLGNAVVPQVAEWIGRRILEVTNDGEKRKRQQGDAAQRDRTCAAASRHCEA